MKFKTKGKQYFYTVLVLLLLSNFISGQTQTKTIPVFWQIKTPNSDKVSYILGTNHIFGEPWVRRYPGLQSCIKKSEVFFCETYQTDLESYKRNINKNNSLRTAKELFGSDLPLMDSYFTKIGWVETVTAAFNESDSAVEQFTLLTSMYYQLLHKIIAESDLKKDSITGGMDDVLAKIAHSYNKKIISLDNTDLLGEIDFGDKDAFPSAIILLVKFLNGENIKDKNLFIETFRLYQEGNYSMFTLDKSTDYLHIEKRNRLWAEKLKPFLKDKSCFVAVGAAHLVNNRKDGLIDLIREMGYEVKPVKLNVGR